jgi:ABC-type histidine transport system ATPase subunit
MLVVTHEMGFARRVATRAVVLAEGRIAEEGTPAQVLDAPRSVATRALLGAVGRV